MFRIILRFLVLYLVIVLLAKVFRRAWLSWRVRPAGGGAPPRGEPTASRRDEFDPGDQEIEEATWREIPK